MQEKHCEEKVTQMNDLQHPSQEELRKVPVPGQHFGDGALGRISNGSIHQNQE